MKELINPRSCCKNYHRRYGKVSGIRITETHRDRMSYLKIVNRDLRYWEGVDSLYPYVDYDVDEDAMQRYLEECMDE